MFKVAEKMVATTKAVNTSSKPLLSVIKGVNYPFWSLKIKTLFKSQDLWDLVEIGFIYMELDEPRQQLREAHKKCNVGPTQFLATRFFILKPIRATACRFLL